MTAHRSIYGLSVSDGLSRFSEVRPDVVILPMKNTAEDKKISRLIHRIREEPCGKNIPVILYNPTENKIADARRVLKTVGASAFLPWPPRSDLLAKAIAILTQELSTDGAAPPPQEEATVEITINHEDELEIDPLLAEAARAMDEDLDDIPTNPRQALAEKTADVVEVHVGDSGQSKQGRSANALADPAQESSAHVGVDDLGTQELIPVFRAPSGLEPTPSLFAEALLEKSLQDSESISDSSLSVPEFLREPELPSRETGSAKISDTARKRIQETPRSEEGYLDSSSQKNISDDNSGQNSLAGRRGLDESRLGKRLVRRINKTHNALSALNYYELLGLDANCSAIALRDAYFSLSLEFHPDRFFLMTSGVLKEKIYLIFRRINEAYVVLSDSRRRDTYDAGLKATIPLKRAVTNERGFSPVANAPMDHSHALNIKTTTPQAEDFIKRAQIAYDQSDYDGARMYMNLAYACEPQSREIKESMKAFLAARPPLNSCRRW